MKNKIENASCENLKNGYFLKENPIDKTKAYFCLFCNAKYEEGDIYEFGKRLVNAEKAMQLHIQKEHGDVFGNLLAEEKAKTGLTETQKEFLANYYSGMADKQIAERMGISESTVRYQRYSFREKAKQAKFIIALSELLEEKEKITVAPAVETDENQKMLESLFESVSPLVLKTFDFGKNKNKKRLFILETISKQFEKGKTYTDKETNAILKGIYSDFATIRRSLVDCGFMQRTNDCKKYWLNQQPPIS
ncbi:MAG: DUF2087 domain-containing protein [Oscillospiraceae bacterium]|nr:DUF2087 domain-containing protein [Oscillospiraceae bacterium]